MSTKHKSAHTESIETTTEETTVTPKTHSNHSHTKTPAHPDTNEETTMLSSPSKTADAHTTTEETTMSTKPQTTSTTAHVTNPQETTMSPTTSTITPAGSTSITTAAGLAAIVATLSAALDSAEAQMGPEVPAITAAQKKRTGKPRKGSDKVLLQMAPVVDQYKLNSDSLNTTAMLALYNVAQTLLPLQARLQKITKRVDDEVFDAQTGSWEMGLQLYGLLQRRAKSSGDIAKSIAPLVKVFSYRHPSAKKTTKETTRAAAKLKEALAIAQKHDVSMSVAPDGSIEVTKGAPAAVAAAQAEMAAAGISTGGGSAATVPSVAAPVAATPVATGVPVAAPVSPAAVVPAVAGH